MMSGDELGSALEARIASALREGVASTPEARDRVMRAIRASVPPVRPEERGDPRLAGLVMTPMSGLGEGSRAAIARSGARRPSACSRRRRSPG